MNFIEILLPLIYAAAGVALKTLWDSYVVKKRTIELETWKIRVQELEKRLSQFYWPIYLRLQRDNAVWELILDRHNPEDEGKRQLAYQIDEGVLLPNHAEIVSIIESNIHLAALDKEFEKLMLDYLRHIDVYRSLREVGIKDKDPIDFGQPYPNGFFKALEGKLKMYQSEYEQILLDKGIS